ncbi:ribbon-helix-helix domain-containing protein [Aliarcobacter butzleri]|uniref:ribbon-helix-helix domain-containing protein n=1 Tax=Aliarcobacter butzleri TaxID=28197 RepID=UPI0021B6907E|nr:ribbon-helix-helix domain-containing protein [Aliarcobacter butzleri]MCT7574923.1 ribbon-helix-helix domain-containing protein [Aliarcobacter butzleri]MDK2081354.1 ribbon-helix-helix domain-containing protein [Aliarcobacter butzleri]
MVATVRLDENLEKTLDNISKILDKKRSDIIREAISFYAKSIETNKKSRILNAIEKTKKSDKKLYDNFESTINDSI